MPTISEIFIVVGLIFGTMLVPLTARVSIAVAREMFKAVNDMFSRKG